MKSDIRPLLISEHNNGDSSPGKILLVADILIRGQQQVVAAVFGLPKQLTILELVPADLPCEGHLMPGQTAGDGIGRAVVKENSHP